MTTSAEQVRAYAGPAFLSFGFRPFFLGGAIWSAVAMALWLPMLAGTLTLPTAFNLFEWHVHELLYGYLPAVVAGFLLTAVPNWTGRLPILGTPLLLLFLLWIAGRIAVMTSAVTGLWFAAAVDLAFLASVIAVIAREIVAGQNLKNLRVLLLVSVLLVGNAVFHVEAGLGTGSGYGKRIGIAAAVLLISPSVAVSCRASRALACKARARPLAGSLQRFDALSVMPQRPRCQLILAPDAIPTAILLLIAGAFTHTAGAVAGERTMRAIGSGAARRLRVRSAGFFLVALDRCADVVSASARFMADGGSHWAHDVAVMTRASLDTLGES
jgi:uncharacterized protein involved in response to NO